MMKKVVIFIGLLIFLLVVWVPAQETDKGSITTGGAGSTGISLLVTPGVNIPVGTPTEMFTVGGGMELSGIFPMPFAQWLHARGGFDYSIVPTAAAEPKLLSLLTLDAGAGVDFEFIPRLHLHAAMLGGYGLGLYEGESGGSFYFGGEGGISFFFSPSFGIGAGAAYHHYFSQPTPFYQAVKVHIGAQITFGQGERKPFIEINDIRFDPIFPVFYKHYDDHQLGSLVVENTEKGTVRDVAVSFFVPQYMNKPKVCATFEEMKRGEQREVPLYALFTDQVLTITEGTKVAAEVEVSYTISGADLIKAESQTLRLYDRNAMTWDDDRKASAFITAKDPAVLRFAKSTAGFIREHHNKAVNLTFRIGMGIFEALQLHGINYVVDPQTPYEEFSEDTDAIDYLQFPVHTMTYKAGDCDDLSILYCALLESAGIETAFITVPGHIFAAFNLGMAPEEAKKLFLNPGDLIYQEDETWVPVEITLVREGFLRAWEKGASEWREFVPSGNARFYPVHEAWSEYEPVGLPDAAPGLEFPADEQIAAAYTKAVTRFVEREIAEKVERYLTRIESSNNNPKYINGLGVLYAKYGLLDKAEGRFVAAVRSQYVPAMINLGNVLFLQEKLEESLRYFAMARSERPESTQAMLGIAKAQYELENFTAVKETYSQIQRKDPDLAGRFAYLAGGSGGEQTARASAAMRKETVVWAEEEE